MKLFLCLALCCLPWQAWARPNITEAELDALHRQGKTFKSSLPAPVNNDVWVMDLTADKFKLDKARSSKGVWSTTSSAGVASFQLPETLYKSVLRLEVSAVVTRGAVRLEGGGQELLSYTVDPAKSGMEFPLKQNFNVDVNSNGVVRWMLQPNSQLRLDNIKVFKFR